MFLKKKIIAIIIARGGSKGIKLKNLRKIKGKSLINHVGNFCKSLKFLDESIISSDNKKIIAEGVRAGLKAPFVRSKILSKDLVPDEKVLIDALNRIEKINNVKYDVVLSLPPTSPFREKKDILKSLRLLIKSKYDSVWTVSKNDSKNHPLKQLAISKENKIKYYLKKGSKIFARQQLNTLYYRDGSAYVITRETLLKKKKLITNNTGAVVTKNFKISIDNYFDLKLANIFFK